MHRLKSALALLAGCVVVAYGLSACQQAGPANSNTANANSNAAGLISTGPGAPGATPCPPYPAPSGSPPFVDPAPNPCIPYAVSASETAFSGDGGVGTGVATAQPFFDVFSWRSFVALNSPADGSRIGSAPDGDAPTVWENYVESYQVFLPDGSQPQWPPSVGVPEACRNVAQGGGEKVSALRMIAKVSEQLQGTVLDERGEPFRTGPLIDPRGQYVRYAIHLNRETFDYIVGNKLYNKAGQAAFANAVDMPSGDNNAKAVGAMVIKSAWRILDPAQGDKPERYHKIRAFVYNAPSEDPPVGAQCSLQTLGLIGFHVMHKTTAAPQWVWSTFEQVDNVRADAAAGVPATFFDPKHPGRKINQPPDKPWDPTRPATPSQLARLIPIDQPTQALNTAWQKMLAGVNPKSVWQFYQLISTQWPTQARIANPNDPRAKITNPGFGAPAPPVLANITLETYTQRSSSCIACHKNATTTNSKFGDFSYLLQRAQ